MSTIEGTFFDFKNLDQLATGDTVIHRLDPRAKVVVTLFFIITVVSFGRYELTALLPFFIFPAVIIALGNLPVVYIVKKVTVIIPFALAVGMLNPLFDRQVFFHFGTMAITGGWISFASIVVRAVLTAGGAMILVAVTGYPAICMALERMGMPQPFAVQLLFLYRYIFVLAEEGVRMSRARELRSFGNKGKGIQSYGPLFGHLLLRTWLRAERIHMAMMARGFTGAFHTRHSYRFGRKEIVFLLGWSSLFIFMRLQNASQLLGSIVTGMLR